MQAELEKLLDLQVKDLGILEKEARLQAIAEEVAAFDREVEARGREEQVARTRHADGVQRRESIEVRIESYRLIQDRRRQRLEGARGAREAQALLTEVEMARTVLVREETEWVRAAEAASALERTIREIEAAVVELQVVQAPDRERLATERRQIESELDQDRAARETAANEVDRSLRNRYDRLQAARATSVVVPLHGDACGACYTAVTRNRRTQIRAGILLDNCEACGVILYAEDES